MVKIEVKVRMSWHFVYSWSYNYDYGDDSVLLAVSSRSEECSLEDCPPTSWSQNYFVWKGIRRRTWFYFSSSSLQVGSLPWQEHFFNMFRKHLPRWVLWQICGIGSIRVKGNFFDVDERCSQIWESDHLSKMSSTRLVVVMWWWKSDNLSFASQSLTLTDGRVKVIGEWVNDTGYAWCLMFTQKNTFDNQLERIISLSRFRKCLLILMKNFRHNERLPSILLAQEFLVSFSGNLMTASIVTWYKVTVRERGVDGFSAMYRGRDGLHGSDG